MSFLPERWREFVEHRLLPLEQWSEADDFDPVHISTFCYGEWWCCVAPVGDAIARFLIFRLSEDEEHMTLLGPGEHSGDGATLMRWLEATESSEYYEHEYSESLTYRFPHEPIVSTYTRILGLNGSPSCFSFHYRGWEVTINSREHLGPRVRLWIKCPKLQFRYAWVEDAYGEETRELLRAIRPRSEYTGADLKTVQVPALGGGSESLSYFEFPLKKYGLSRLYG